MGSASRRRHCDDEAGWCELAHVLGLEELYKALKACKPWDWNEAAKLAASELSPPAQPQMQEEEVDEETLAKRATIERIKAEESSYLERVEQWWNEILLPVLEAERRLAS